MEVDEKILDQTFPFNTFPSNVALSKFPLEIFALLQLEIWKDSYNVFISE